MTQHIDLTSHQLKNTELMTRIYTHLLEQHASINPVYFQNIVEDPNVKRDIQNMDALIQQLRDSGEDNNEVIYKTVIDRVYGRRTH